MALFHLSVTQTKRSAGQSAIASAAYRAGERLYSEYYGEYSDYTRKGGVICSDIFLPSHLKSKYPRITLESAIPCETQAIKWSVASRERYYNIAAKCDKETMLQREYTPDCMDKRNRYMVDHADYILAVWNGCPSGTGNTVRYAHQKSKTIIVINPVSLDVTRE